MSTETEAGFRALAAAVLVRAIKDANYQPDERLPKTERRSLMKDAREFLAPRHHMFGIYCGLLGSDPEYMADAAKRRGRLLTEQARRGDRRRERQEKVVAEGG